MFELAVEDPGHDLHVSVGVGVEARPAGDPIVVEYEQLTVVRVVGGVVAAEAERVSRIEPADTGVESLARAADVDQGRDHVR